ncbi:MAG: proline--tRNA ligase [Clostridia bacterium]|nr:proline--tRNA ligase [Clostridia bacterium]MBR6719697.1 proline--tRNA ligase [Clostridia bacterium]
MKASKLLMPTLREAPAEAEIASHVLMMRAGLISKLAAGVYSYLPLGLRVLQNTERIIREEMNKAGAQELLMSALLPAECYQKSGRWDRFGDDMFRLKDRNSRDFCLGPTHEEIFTQTVIDSVHSYKDYPYTLYQIQTKYRDERRPRFGVMRTREFLMKDAYSFDISREGLDESYKAMYDAYRKTFDRMGLNYMIVDADTGAMGGSGSQEFMVISDVGEDTIAYCEDCRYSANIEKAVCITGEADNSEMLPMNKVATPDAKTIEEVAAFFGKEAKDFVKTMIYNAEGKLYAVLVRGDREINEVKLANKLGVGEVALADPADVVEVTNAKVGFAGPVGLKIDIVADNEVMKMRNFIVGANETDCHIENVNPERDFTAAIVDDIRNIEDGDICPVCGKTIKTAQGIEVGHIFKLGTKYSEALGLNYVDEKGEENPVIMGCYGIGINRCVAAIIEQNNDDAGIIWPMDVAPYKAVVVPVNVKDETQLNLAEKITKELEDAGVEVIIDDRDERPGVKFKDWDLIGIPVRITVGKKASDGIVEYKLRAEKEYTDMTAEDAVKTALDLIKK